MAKTPGSLFKLFATAEVFTWALLLSGLAAKQFAGAPAWVVTVVGSIHGAVFLGYGVVAALVGVNQRWSLGRIALAVLLAIVPFATLPFDRALDRKQALLGQWRREHSGHARDDHWFDRLYRWFIVRPFLLVTTLIIVIVFIFAVLLMVGPPGGSPTGE